jgi:hypothetical protein
MSLTELTDAIELRDRMHKILKAHGIVDELQVSLCSLEISDLMREFIIRAEKRRMIKWQNKRIVFQGG